MNSRQYKKSWTVELFLDFINWMVLFRTELKAALMTIRNHYGVTNDLYPEYNFTGISDIVKGCQGELI